MIRAAVAIALAYLMSAHAETFKCKQPDGSTAFQDFACGTSAPGPAAKSAPKTTPLPAGGSLPPSGQYAPGSNPACAPENAVALKVCMPQFNEAISRCAASTLSPVCAQQFQGPVEKHSAACNREIPRRLRECLPVANASKAQCLAMNLPAKCR
jgi:hypothetical protein